MAASVVDLPEPVGPVTTTRPRCSMQNFFSTAGSGASNFSKSSNESTLLGIWRNTAAMPFFWLKKLARKREMLRNFVAEIHVAGFFEDLDLVLRRDFVEHRLEIVVFQRRMIHAMQFAVDAQHGVVARRKVQVRGLLLEHQIEESINFRHKIPYRLGDW